jgi:endonuclease YncB( thermonuclease family)
MRVVVVVSVLAAVAPAALRGDEPAAVTWRVVSVHDGDTVVCLDDQKVQHKVRLSGIDAPEIGQAFGTKSRDALRARVLRKPVAVHRRGEDQYGRTLATLEFEGDDVAEWMVAAGMAWHYKRYSDDKALAAAERKARSARTGLWADGDPMPPWKWRASERDRKEESRSGSGPAGAKPASRSAAPRTSVRPPPKAVPAASPGPRRAAAVVGADAE